MLRLALSSPLLSPFGIESATVSALHRCEPPPGKKVTYGFRLSSTRPVLGGMRQTQIDGLERIMR